MYDKKIKEIKKNDAGLKNDARWVDKLINFFKALKEYDDNTKHEYITTRKTCLSFLTILRLSLSYLTMIITVALLYYGKLNYIFVLFTHHIVVDIL